MKPPGLPRLDSSRRCRPVPLQWGSHKPWQKIREPDSEPLLESFAVQGVAVSRTVSPAADHRECRAADALQNGQTAFNYTAVRSAATDACCWSKLWNRCAPRPLFSSTVRDAMATTAQRPIAQHCLDAGVIELPPAPAPCAFPHVSRLYAALEQHRSYSNHHKPSCQSTFDDLPEHGYGRPKTFKSLQPGSAARFNGLYRKRPPLPSQRLLARSPARRALPIQLSSLPPTIADARGPGRRLKQTETESTQGPGPEKIGLLVAWLVTISYFFAAESGCRGRPNHLALQHQRRVR